MGSVDLGGGGTVGPEGDVHKGQHDFAFSSPEGLAQARERALSPLPSSAPGAQPARAHKSYYKPERKNLT